MALVLVAQSCLTLCDPMDCSPPDSTLHGILQARILEYAAISFSRGSSQPRDWTRLSHTAGRRFTYWATVKPMGVSSWTPWSKRGNAAKLHECAQLDPWPLWPWRMSQTMKNPSRARPAHFSVRMVLQVRVDYWLSRRIWGQYLTLDVLWVFLMSFYIPSIKWSVGKSKASKFKFKRSGVLNQEKEMENHLETPSDSAIF